MWVEGLCIVDVEVVVGGEIGVVVCLVARMVEVAVVVVDAKNQKISISYSMD